MESKITFELLNYTMFINFFVLIILKGSGKVFEVIAVVVAMSHSLMTMPSEEAGGEKGNGLLKAVKRSLLDPF